jgi:3-oxoacyl-[acyl-carrier-protein] synthase II
MTRDEVWVTGMGLATAMAPDLPGSWAALAGGRSGIAPIARFDTTGLRTTIGATASYRSLDRLSYTARTARLATMVMAEALRGAGLPDGAAGAPLILGLPPIETPWSDRLAAARKLGGGGPVDYAAMLAATGPADAALYSANAVDQVASGLAAAHGCGGAPVTLNTACSTGATAIQIGAEMIRDGLSERVLVAAADAPIIPDTIVRFSLLAALSMSNALGAGAARPFAADRDGFVLGEGAAALVLERADAAGARGAVPLARVSGLGEAADTFHLTRSSPDAGAALRAMAQAIADAGLPPEAIGYVNAHGTGTPENDRNEALAMRRLFGEGRCPPISSTKSMTGHTLSAAGAVEAVIAILALRHGVLPPTLNHARPDPEIGLDVVPGVARRAAPRHVLSNSFGFGGQNVCLVLSAAE